MRINSIDVFRGLCVFLMLFMNRISDFIDTPDYLLHAEELGAITLGDLVAPFFLFIVGVCMYISFDNRRKLGRWGISRHFIKRGLLVIALGLALDMIWDWTLVDWGVLEAIGASILLTFGFIWLPRKIRLASVLMIATAYGLLSQHPVFIDAVQYMPHGSPAGVISWSVISIFGTVIGEILMNTKEKGQFLVTLVKIGAAFCAVGYFTSYYVPFSKELVSASFSLFSSGASALLFSAIYFLVDIRGLKFPALKDFGMNALLGFIYSYVSMTVVIWSGIGEITGFPLSIMPVMGVIAVFWGIVRVLNRKNIFLKL